MNDLLNALERWHTKRDKESLENLYSTYSKYKESLYIEEVVIDSCSCGSPASSNPGGISCKVCKNSVSRFGKTQAAVISKWNNKEYDS